MNNQLCILICENHLAEAEQALQDEYREEVRLVPFPVLCDRPPFKNDVLLNIIRSKKTEFEHFCVIGGSCTAQINSMNLTDKNCRILDLESCFELFLPRQTVRDLISKGTYLMTPGWLSRWRKLIKIWGFDRRSARSFFKESMSEIVLLDTGSDEKSMNNLQEFSEYIHIPGRAIPVGTDHLRLILDGICMEWRLQNTESHAQKVQSALNRKLSDDAMVFDLLSDLVGLSDEDKVIKKIIDLFQMLYAPAETIYFKIDEGKTGKAITQPKSLKVSLNIKNEMVSLDQDFQWMESKTGFYVKIKSKDKILGVIRISGFRFPEYQDLYLDNILTIIPACALAVSNSRSFEKIKRVENQLRKNLLEKELLLKEVNHRVKNNLAVVNSLLNLQAGKIRDKKAIQAIRESQNRIHSISTIHEMLYKSDSLAHIDFQRYLENLTSYIFKVHKIDSEKVKMKIDAKGVQLGIDLGIPCALILNEIITNSLKYAFSDGRAGEISVKLSKTFDTYNLEVSDNGIGMSPDFKIEDSDSLGFQLVDLLVGQIGGKLQLNRIGGTTYLIRFKKTL